MKSQFEKEFRHCPSCGGMLYRRKTPYLRLHCRKCGAIRYLNPKVGIAAIVECDQGIVFSRRAIAPYKGYWTIPSGYVEYEESCEEAVIREAKEELGIDAKLLSLQDVYSYQDDPRANMVLVVYVCSILSGTLKAEDDISEIRICNKHNMPKRIAFSGVRQAVRDYWNSKIRMS